MKLSLVIPCYNEAESLPALIGRLNTLPLKREGAEIILVDNGSNDKTRSMLKDLLGEGGAIRSVRVARNRGYGFGIRAGLKAAAGDVLGWTHADLQADPADALKAFAHFRLAPEPERLFVKGLRYGRPMADVVFTHAMSLFETLLLQKPFNDINAQPTLFSRALYESWGDDAPDDFSLDLFAYHSALRAGCVVERLSVRFGERRFGASHWNIDWRSKLKFMRRTASYSLALRRRLVALEDAEAIRRS